MFDPDRQHIIAEATPNLPLAPRLKHKDQNGENLWLCGTAIPRARGACSYALSYNSLTSLHDTKLPLVIVDDLQADGRFEYEPYCRPGCPAKFYAAVPIRSRRGINIGVLCVLSPHDIEWNDRKTEVMRNLSRTIMERLEATRAKAANRRSERMNRGLGSFVEGRATLTGWRFGPNAAAYKSNAKFEGALNTNQQLLHQQEDSPATSTGIGGTFPFPLMVPGPVDDSTAETFSAGRRNSLDTTTTSELTVDDTFSKAANIIRESIEVEGCLFLDAAVGSFRPAENSRRDSHSEVSGSSDGETRDSPHDDAFQSTCNVLGFSTTDVSSIDGGKNSVRHGAMQEKFLLGLLRRYPKGHIFNFDNEGELQSSDSSEGPSSEGTPTTRSPSNAPNQGMGLVLPTSRTTSVTSAGGLTPGGRHRDRLAGTGSEGSQLLQVFPGARSVAFVPVWDSRKERWCAGGFIYTHTPTRVFTTEGELSYMRAFGMLAMAETLRCETLLSEKAKTDALSSLSHEIRSPLRTCVVLNYGCPLVTLSVIFLSSLHWTGMSLVFNVDSFHICTDHECLLSSSRPPHSPPGRNIPSATRLR